MEDPVSISKEIPVIDLGKAKGEERALVIQQLVQACEEFGLFQVINHGVPENLMDEAMKVYQEFFNFPEEDKAKYAKSTENLLDDGVVFHKCSTLNPGIEKYEYWREVLQQPCNVEGEDKKMWPDKPSRYREVIGTYSAEVGKLSKLIMNLVSEALGLEIGYFDTNCGMTILGIHYPACPRPSSTLGIGGHCDPNLITILQQQVYGLELLKDGKWIGVEPLPHAFVVNSGLALTVISNGKLQGVAHRAVANTTQPRISIATFVKPEPMIEPAKALVSPCNPPLFKSCNWDTEFIPYHFSNKLGYDAALDHFKIDA